MSTTLLEGHVVDVLATLPAGHFHTVCTSPPYWQLRVYGTPPQVWDGAEGCAHSWEALPEWTKGGTGQNSTLINSPEYRQSRDTDAQKLKPGAFCARCGAWRGELGQEPTPELFVQHLVAVFSAVRRVLRDDGTLWVNLAGSYWSEPGGQNGTGQSTLMGANTKHHALRSISEKAKEANRKNGRQKRGQHPVYKPLDWVDVPGLFARAMQAAGWLWRSDVVWVKPSALPESVQGTRWEKCRIKMAPAPRSAQACKTDPQRANGKDAQGLTVRPPGGTPVFVSQAEWADCPGCPKCAQTEGLVLRRGSGRPTKATERVLLFSKRQGYFFDQEAVRENLAEATLERERYSHAGGDKHQPLQPGDGNMTEEGLTRTTAGLMRERASPSAGRHVRDWWVLGPEPLKDAHYAAFPSALPERCIRAGTSEWGCCPGCGAPWARVVERVGVRELIAAQGKPPRLPEKNVRLSEEWDGRSVLSRNRGDPTTADVTTMGWRPTCPCGVDLPPSPCRVLDPFAGSGTTLLAANRLGRDAWGVELKPAYMALARKRVGREPLSLFATHGDTGGILPLEEAEGALAGG